MSGRTKIGRNDPCHCRSGRKYKHCHMRQDRREGNVTYAQTFEIPRSEKTLVENTLNFIGYLKDLFGISFNAKTGEGHVSGSVTASDVKSLYQNLPAYFPHEAPIKDIYKDIGRHSHTGIYWGTPNINNIATYLVRYALYVPRIIVNNPFCDLMLYHMDASPLDVPEQWMQIAINQALYLVSIEPWIREGIIIPLPPIKWFDYEFFKNQIQPLSKASLASLDENQRQTLMASSFLEQLHNWSPDTIQFILEEARKEGMPQELFQAAREVAATESKRNPIRYHWSDKQSSILKTGAGVTFEEILFTSELCNAHLLLGESYYKQNFDFAVESGVRTKPKQMTYLARAFSDLEFSFLNAVSLDFVLGLRKDNKLGGLRTFLGRLWGTISSQEELQKKDDYLTFKDELEEQYQVYREEWDDISKSLAVKGASALLGTGTVILSGHFGLQIGAGVLAALGINALLASYDERRKKKRHPLGVFLKLEQTSG